MWRGYTEEFLLMMNTAELEELLLEHGFSENGDWQLDIDFIRCVTEILNMRAVLP